MNVISKLNMCNLNFRKKKNFKFLIHFLLFLWILSPTNRIASVPVSKVSISTYSPQSHQT